LALYRFINLALKNLVKIHSNDVSQLASFRCSRLCIRECHPRH